MGSLLCTVLVWRSCCGESAMYCPGVEVLLLGVCYVLHWCGGVVVRRPLCIVLVWRCCCGETTMYCTGVEVLLWGVAMYFPVVEVLLWGGYYIQYRFGGAVVGTLLCAVLLWKSCCGEAAIYCSGLEVL